MRATMPATTPPAMAPVLLRWSMLPCCSLPSSALEGRDVPVDDAKDVKEVRASDERGSVDVAGGVAEVVEGLGDDAET